MVTERDAGSPATAGPQASEVAQLSLIAGFYGLAILNLVSLLGNINFSVLPLILEPARQSIAMNDAQIGALRGFGTTLVMALGTYPLGWLVDRVDQRRLLAVCVLIWSAGTAWIGLARSYPELFGAVVTMSLGESVLGIIPYTLIPVLLARRHWVLANNLTQVVTMLAGGAGLMLGSAMMGYAANHRAQLPTMVASFDSWRLPLLGLALIGPAIALLVLTVPAVKVPRKQAASEAAQATAMPGVIPYFRTHFRTFVGVYGGFSMLYCGAGVVGTFAPIALIRVFRVPAEQVGTILGPVFTGFAVSGILLGGLLLPPARRRFGNLAPLRLGEMFGLVAIIGSALMGLAVNTLQFYVGAGLTMMACVAALALSVIVVQTTAPLAIRGRIIALGTAGSYVFLSLAPIFAGAASDYLQPDPHAVINGILVFVIPCFAVALLMLRYSEGSLQATLDAAG